MPATKNDDSIIALASAQGISAIAVIRLSGKDCIAITQKVFHGKKLEDQPSHTIHLGSLKDNDRMIDEVLVTVFREPNSFTRENSIEISCHGSPVIVKEIIKVLIKNGARLAKPGEFTKRAFLNGRFDLTQAEAVADLIASQNESQHRLALQQLRGGITKEIQHLRKELIHFASLIELELDFSEEDVEFADRSQLTDFIRNKLLNKIQQLISSFSAGNAIKNGIPIVIAGKPNVGKSTLLNALLKEEKAIVSDIPGTTRDFIEDELIIEGVTFRIIDTAGLRATEDKIEALGVERTHQKINTASLLLFVFDLSLIKHPADYDREHEIAKSYNIPYIMVGNKVEYCSDMAWTTLGSKEEVVLISALNGSNLDELHHKMLETAQARHFKTADLLVANVRHYESLKQTEKALNTVLEGIHQGLSGDLLSVDIRNALHHLGEITGEITTDDLLENIFSKFCIGK